MLAIREVKFVGNDNCQLKNLPNIVTWETNFDLELDVDARDIEGLRFKDTTSYFCEDQYPPMVRRSFQR